MFSISASRDKDIGCWYWVLIGRLGRLTHSNVFTDKISQASVRFLMIFLNIIIIFSIFDNFIKNCIGSCWDTLIRMAWNVIVKKQRNMKYFVDQILKSILKISRVNHRMNVKVLLNSTENQFILRFYWKYSVFWYRRLKLCS